MWGIVLWTALVAVPDPVRMGIAVLLISQPRPLLNLFAFWLGGVTTGSVVGLSALLLLRDASTGPVGAVRSTVGQLGDGRAQIVIGLLMVSIAAVVAVRHERRQRRWPEHAGAASGPVPKPATGLARLSDRARDALTNGHPWVAYVAGLGSATPPVQYPLALAAILASGAAIGTQFGAAIAFTLGALLLVEIPLLSYLVAPARTQAITLQVHGWVRVHWQKILVGSAAVLGLVLIVKGMGPA